jgi:hypothetical protein
LLQGKSATWQQENAASRQQQHPPAACITTQQAVKAMKWDAAEKHKSPDMLLCTHKAPQAASTSTIELLDGH